VLRDVRRCAHEQRPAVLAAEHAGVDAESPGAGDGVDDLLALGHPHHPAAHRVGRPDAALGVQRAPVRGGTPWVFIETTTSDPSGSHPRPEGCPGTSNSTVSRPSAVTRLTVCR
jgi:hypothetical protein